MTVNRHHILPWVRRIILLLSFGSAASCSRDLVMQEMTETRVTPEGGTARSFDGLVEIVFPPGALDGAATVMIEPMRSVSVPQQISGAYDIQLIGAGLRERADLRIYTEATGTLRLGHIVGDQTMLVEGSGLDPDRGFVHAWVEHFSVYCIIGGGGAPDAAVADGAPIEDAAAEDAGVDEDAQTPGDAQPGQDAADGGFINPDAGGSGGTCMGDAGTSSSLTADLAILCNAPLAAGWTIGSPQTVSFEVMNVGMMDAPVTQAMVVLSANQLITLTDPLLATLPVPPLAAMMSTMLTATITVPVVQAGAYYVGGIADSAFVISEDREQNNIRRFDTQVNVNP